MIISTNARSGRCRVKNKIDHNRFKTIWMEKKTIASVAPRFCFLLDQTKNKAIPIKMKSKVQTGANIQLGGLKLGFSKPAYQLGIDGLVAKDPINPTASGISTQTAN